jgi:hypothetical protein
MIMKRIITVLNAALLLAMMSCDVSVDVSSDLSSGRDILQLKIYQYHSPDQEKLLDEYLGDALIPALHRAEIENVGVFKPIQETDEDKKFIFVLIPYSSLEEFDDIPGILKQDQEYLVDGEDYIEAPHDAPPYDRIESMLLRAFSATPQLTVPDLESPRSGRVYELRSYHAATEKLYKRKVEMFDEGESELFIKLDFNPVFFGEVISSAHMPHLMYMTTFADTLAQQDRWNAFREHPDWLEMKEIEKYKNTVSHIDKYLLYPTDYSDY